MSDLVEIEENAIRPGALTRLRPIAKLAFLVILVDGVARLVLWMFF
jgi:hypothetical protein